MNIVQDSRGCILNVWVQPRASKNELVGLHGACLKVKLAAPPVENKANEELVHYLRELLQVPAANVQIIAGKKSRKKTILIKGLELEELEQCLGFGS